MATDRNEMTDEVTITLSGVEVVDLPSIPERPSDNATKVKWVEYVVALGADRDYVVGDTEHFEPDDYEGDLLVGEVYTHPGLTVSELQDLADRLGG